MPYKTLGSKFYLGKFNISWDIYFLQPTICWNYIKSSSKIGLLHFCRFHCCFLMILKYTSTDKLFGIVLMNSSYFEILLYFIKHFEVFLFPVYFVIKYSDEESDFSILKAVFEGWLNQIHYCFWAKLHWKYSRGNGILLKRWKRSCKYCFL